MRLDDDLRIPLGRSRNGGSSKSKPFVARVLASAERADGIGSRHRGSAHSSFGRGRAAAFAASRLLTSRSRGVVVKARVVRHPFKATNLSAHLAYLRRDDVSRDGDYADVRCRQ